ADDKPLFKHKAHGSGLDRHPAGALLIDERHQLGRGSVPAYYLLQEKLGGVTGLYQALYQHHVFSLHIEGGPVVDLYMRRIAWSRLFLRLHELAGHRNFDGADSIGGAAKAVRPHTKQHEIL